MERPARLVLPKRVVKKTTVTLPLDQLDFLDTCSDAVGHSRSSFLTLVLDGFYDEIIAFAKGYATRIIEQAAITEEMKRKTQPQR